MKLKYSLLVFYLTFAVALTPKNVFSSSTQQTESTECAPQLNATNAPLLPDEDPPEPYGWAWLGRILGNLATSDKINDLTTEKLEEEALTFLTDYATSSIALLVVPSVVFLIAIFGLFFYPCILSCCCCCKCCCFTKENREYSTAQKIVPVIIMGVFAIFAIIMIIACADSYSYITHKGFDGLVVQMEELMPNVKTQLHTVLDTASDNIDEAFDDVNEIIESIVDGESYAGQILKSAQDLVKEIEPIHDELENVKGEITSLMANGLIDQETKNMLNGISATISSVNDITDTVEFAVPSDLKGLIDLSEITSQINSVGDDIKNEISSIDNEVSSFTDDFSSNIDDFIVSSEDFMKYAKNTVYFTVLVSLLAIPFILIALGFVCKMNKCWVIGSLIAVFILFLVVFVGFFVYIIAIPTNQVCGVLRSEKRIALLDSLEDENLKNMIDMFYECRSDKTTDVFSNIIDIFMDPDSGINLKECDSLFEENFGSDQINDLVDQITNSLEFDDADNLNGLTDDIDVAIEAINGALETLICCDGVDFVLCVSMPTPSACVDVDFIEEWDDINISGNLNDFEPFVEISKSLTKIRAIIEKIYVFITDDLRDVSVSIKNEIDRVKDDTCDVYDNFLTSMSDVVKCSVLFDIIDPPLLQVCGAYIPSIGTVGVSSIAVGLFMYIVLLLACCCTHRFKKPNSVDDEHSDKASVGIEFESVNVIKTHGSSQSFSSASASISSNKGKKHKHKPSHNHHTSNMLPQDNTNINNGVGMNRNEETDVAVYAPIYPVFNMQYEGNAKTTQESDMNNSMMKSNNMNASEPYYEVGFSNAIEMETIIPPPKLIASSSSSSSSSSSEMRSRSSSRSSSTSTSTTHAQIKPSDTTEMGTEIKEDIVLRFPPPAYQMKSEMAMQLNVAPPPMQMPLIVEEKPELPEDDEEESEEVEQKLELPEEDDEEEIEDDEEEEKEEMEEEEVREEEVKEEEDEEEEIAVKEEAQKPELPEDDEDEIEEAKAEVDEEEREEEGKPELPEEDVRSRSSSFSSVASLSSTGSSDASTVDESDHED